MYISSTSKDLVMNGISPFFLPRPLVAFSLEEIQWLSEPFLENKLSDWIVAMFMVLGTILAARALYWFLEKYIKKLTDKTKTKLDDLIVDTFEKPLVFAGAFIGAWFGFRYLDFGAFPGVEVWLNGFFSVLMTFLVAWLLCRVLEAILDEYAAPYFENTETDLDDVLLPIARRGLRTIVWVVAIIMALDNAGYDITTVLAGLGVGGLAFALAAKDSLANLFGGFTIFTDKPFGLKDRIKVGGFDGTVTEIGLRSTRLQNLDGRTVTIPNSNIADKAIENISSEPSRKVAVNLGLTYDMDEAMVKHAMEVLNQIVDDHKTNLEDNISVGFNQFGDFALNVVFVYRISKGSDILATQTSINLAILRRFADEGLELAFPTQTILNKNA